MSPETSTPNLAVQTRATSPPANERIAKESDRYRPRREIARAAPDRSKERLASRPPAGPMEPGSLHILAVGVGAYPRRSVPYARRDAEQLGEVLQRSGLGAGGRRGIRIVLIDDAVTLENVERAFDEIARQVQGHPQDTVVVFLAGHTAVLGPQGFCLLLPSYPFPAEAPSLALARDLAADTRPETEADPRFAISYSVLARNLARLQARNRLVIVDACQAEAILDDRQVRAIQRGMEDSSRQAGASHLLVVRRGEPALELAPLGHGLLTYTLLRGMGEIPIEDEPQVLAALDLPRDADFDRDGILSLGEARDLHQAGAPSDRHPVSPARG